MVELFPNGRSRCPESRFAANKDVEWCMFRYTPAAHRWDLGEAKGRWNSGAAGDGWAGPAGEPAGPGLGGAAVRRRRLSGEAILPEAAAGFLLTCAAFPMSARSGAIQFLSRAPPADQKYNRAERCGARPIRTRRGPRSRVRSTSAET